MPARVADRPLRRHLCDTRHGQLHLYAAGDGGVPVVLLHQGGDTGRQYLDVIALLGRDRLAIAPDRLGCGMSSPAPRQFDSASEYALATLDALDSLGVREFDVVGSHSGTVEAVELAVGHPDRVRSVVLAGVPLLDEQERDSTIAYFSTGRRPAPEPDGSHLLTLWRQAREMGRGRHFVFGDPDAERSVNAPPAGPGGWEPELIERYILTVLEAGPNWWWPFVAVFRFPLAERLPAVTQPLVVFNMQDDLWDVCARAKAHLPPNGTYVELPHLDIHAFSLAPEEMSERIRSFVDASREKRSAPLQSGAIPR